MEKRMEEIAVVINCGITMATLCKPYREKKRKR
jgi:hypothetical protein